MWSQPSYQGIDLRSFSAQSNIGGKNSEFISFRIKKIQQEESQTMIERFFIEDLIASPVVHDDLPVTGGSVTVSGVRWHFLKVWYIPINAAAI